LHEEIGAPEFGCLILSSDFHAKRVQFLIFFCNGEKRTLNMSNYIIEQLYIIIWKKKKFGLGKEPPKKKETKKKRWHMPCFKIGLEFGKCALHNNIKFQVPCKKSLLVYIYIYIRI
jgi:hypothetical protein